MTEDEAKLRWCPFVRVLVTPQDATWQGNMLTNRGDIPADNTQTCCIGSACMAWRWSNKMAGHRVDERRGHTQEKVDKFTRENPLKGYCGLAGN